MPELDSAQSAALIAELQAQFIRQGLICEKLETHISYVLLVGDNAYKFKKPLNLGFLDFSTLALRHDYCAREVALNRRYTPTLYRGVLALVRGPQGLSFDTPGDPLNYAVWMQRFPDGERLDQLLDRGAVDTSTFAVLGHAIGEMHLHAPQAPTDRDYGSADLARTQMVAGIDALRDVAPVASQVLDRYRNAIAASSGLLVARQRDGFIRDCHGDLHLSNIVRLKDRLAPFDCLEFNDELRFIDTMSDFAFLKMDLELRKATEYSNTLLNAYLTACGDYGGLALLRVYCAYRSIVRAMVANLASRSLSKPARADALARSARHLQLTEDYLKPPPTPTLLITHGVSASGKSWRSRRIVAHYGYIHLRSDIKRRRLVGLIESAPSHSPLNAGMYDARQTEFTYLRLSMLAAVVLRAGYSVIVDATFLTARQRAAFRQLAHERNIPFGILACAAPEPVLRARIEARRAAATDPSEATQEVLARQLATCEPLNALEQAAVFDERQSSLETETHGGQDGDSGTALSSQRFERRD